MKKKSDVIMMKTNKDTQLVEYHIPAMLSETIQGLNIQPNGLYVDVTFGGGGHSRAILEALRAGVELGSGKLYSFDQDLDALHNAMNGSEWRRIIQSGSSYIAISAICVTSWTTMAWSK